MSRPLSTPASLAIEAVSRRYDSTLAVNSVSLTAAAGQIMCLLGQSGCGKTTLLRLIAGIEPPDSGAIRFGDRIVSDSSSFVPPEKRAVGMVFQDYALFPHLTIRDNVMFGLSGQPSAQRRERAVAMLEQVQLAHLSDSYPHMLSGGEQQRAALARAMAPAPQLMLMDEPFSNLDRRLRDSVRDQTIALLRRTGVTAVIVTHDPEEALRIADRIVLMRKGSVMQAGTPEELYRKPASLFAARFFCDLNMLAGRAADGVVTTKLGRFNAPGLADASAAMVAIRPHDLVVSADGVGVPARVMARHFLGDIAELLLTIDGLDTPLKARIPAHISARESETLWLSLAPDTAMVFAAD